MNITKNVIAALILSAAVLPTTAHASAAKDKAASKTTTSARPAADAGSTAGAITVQRGSNNIVG